MEKPMRLQNFGMAIAYGHIICYTSYRIQFFLLYNMQQTILRYLKKLFNDKAAKLKEFPKILLLPLWNGDTRNPIFLPFLPISLSFVILPWFYMVPIALWSIYNVPLPYNKLYNGMCRKDNILWKNRKCRAFWLNFWKSNPGSHFYDPANCFEKGLRYKFMLICFPEFWSNNFKIGAKVGLFLQF